MHTLDRENGAHNLVLPLPVTVNHEGDSYLIGPIIFMRRITLMSLKLLANWLKDALFPA